MARAEVEAAKVVMETIIVYCATRGPLASGYTIRGKSAVAEVGSRVRWQLLADNRPSAVVSNLLTVGDRVAIGTPV